MASAAVASIELAASVCACPQPVIFLDTSAILDILRVPFRHELQVDIVDSAAALVEDWSQRLGAFGWFRHRMSCKSLMPIVKPFCKNSELACRT